MLTTAKIGEHPGKVLARDFFEPRHLTIYRVARETGIDRRAIGGVLTGKKPLPLREAVLLARYFGQEEDFFAQLQLRHDLRRCREQ